MKQARPVVVHVRHDLAMNGPLKHHHVSTSETSVGRQQWPLFQTVDRRHRAPAGQRTQQAT